MFLRRFERIGAVGLLMLGSLGLAAQDKPEQRAQKADEAWLALVDGAKYAESWKAAAPIFQAGVSEERWTKAMDSVRSPLGKVESRTLTDASYSKTLPGAPNGEYVVLHFRTSFEHKKEAVETVVASMEKSGMWKVSGYFIR